MAEENDLRENVLPTVMQQDDSFNSIISFPMLLLHALRIFLHEKGFEDIPYFNEKKLITLFDRFLKCRL
jgi:hypothetical protein